MTGLADQPRAVAGPGAGTGAGDMLLQTLPVLEAMRGIEGWLSDSEADLLAAAAADAVRTSVPTRRFIEVGSYCGRSTVVLGRVLQQLGEAGDRVDAVDPHEGVVGAVGEGLWSGEPTLGRFTRTIRAAGLDRVVRPVVRQVQDVDWDGEITQSSNGFHRWTRRRPGSLAPEPDSLAVEPGLRVVTGRWCELCRFQTCWPV